MLRITGYSDKYSAFPREKVKFYVNSEKNENYDVQIIRLIHGDTNPEGPGYKEEEIGAQCNKLTKEETKEYTVVHILLFLKTKD